MRANLLNPFGPLICLASRSARRAELLTLVGARFETLPVDLDERALATERADAHVLRLSEAKAAAAAAMRRVEGTGNDTVFLGADTIVSIGRTILGKPAGPDEAVRMLGLLSGRVHEVWTGVAVVEPDSGRTVTEAVRSLVKFSRLDEAEIRRYVSTGEPLDKAGAYAVQGGGALFVEAIEGSYSNVVGLPLSHVKQLLALLREAPARGS